VDSSCYLAFSMEPLPSGDLVLYRIFRPFLPVYLSLGLDSLLDLVATQ
jgi:hypothetical protein